MSALSAKRYRVSFIARSWLEITVDAFSKDEAISQAQMAWLADGEAAFRCSYVKDEAWKSEEV